MTPIRLTAQQRRDLVERALAARQQAYAPYSQFAVGAAVLAEDGRIFTGGNVENASYGLTICAERAAVCQAINGGVRQLAAVAIAGASGVPPCGACRQVLAEFAENLLVLLIDPADPTQVEEWSLDDLLPHRFQGQILRPRSPGERS